MFSSLKLNSLKCQSNSASDKKKDKCDDNDDDDDDVSEHMYEKLPSYDNKTCRCHSDYIPRSQKTLKTSCSEKISKWRMECPGITNLRILSPEDDLESKNNQGEKRDLFAPKTPFAVRTKVTTVSVEREDGNLGITLRGGFQHNADLSKPVTITYIKPDGPAARAGTIRCGDRLLAVDGIPLQGKSLCEAQTLLRQTTESTLLTIEYDVNILDSVEHANGSLLIEMELNSFHELGISLSQNENGVIIDGMKPGSLSDRSGALHVGDEILAVNSTRLHCAVLSVEDIMKLIACNCPKLKLEIMPSSIGFNYSDIGTWKSKDHLLSHGSSPSGLSTLKSHGSRRIQDFKALDQNSDPERITDLKSLTLSPAGPHSSNMALTHSETVSTTIFRENGIFGLEFVDSPDGMISISNVLDGSPADRSQCLYPGDRILSVNNKNIALENLKAKDLNDLLNGKPENPSSLKINLLTEFDVLDSVIPTSGVFTVKLAKQGTSGLGITITASKASGFIVCEMKKGSIAYRAGSLIPGDKILAINNTPLSQCSLDYAAHILHQCSKIVALRVQRKDNNSDIKNMRRVTYTVELQRYGGPLGITITGSEEPFHPITISGLSSGGLAEQTGVLYIGDEILAINNHSLYGEPLSKAHTLLQNSPDLVTMKISRAITPYFRFSNNTSPILPPSVDSAVESWESSGLDLAALEYHQKIPRDVRDSRKRNTKMKPFDGHYSEDLEKTHSKTMNEGNITDLSLLDEITSENLKIQKELDLLSLKLDAECKIDFKEVNERGHSHEILSLNFSGHSDIAETTNVDSCDLENSTDDSPRNSSKCGVNVHYIHEDSTPAGVINDPQSQEFGNGYEERGRESFMTNDFENMEMAYFSDSKNWFKSYLGTECSPGSLRNEFQNSQLHKVTLYKDPIYEDFGFSVSDGLYERGVFINRIRKGGPADLNNILKPYDRILQVNDTFTQDFDCCLTVPLIASAGDSITLLVARNSRVYLSDSMLESENRNQGCNNFPILTSSEGYTEGSQRILV